MSVWKDPSSPCRNSCKGFFPNCLKQILLRYSLQMMKYTLVLSVQFDKAWQMCIPEYLPAPSKYRTLGHPWLFQCRGHSFIPGLETKIQQAMWCNQRKNFSTTLQSILPPPLASGNHWSTLRHHRVDLAFLEFHISRMIQCAFCVSFLLFSTMFLR